jgi:hypothetical protein
MDGESQQLKGVLVLFLFFNSILVFAVLGIEFRVFTTFGWVTSDLGPPTSAFRITGTTGEHHHNQPPRFH